MISLDCLLRVLKRGSTSGGSRRKISNRASLHSSTGGGGGEAQGEEVLKKDCMNFNIHFQHLENGILSLLFCICQLEDSLL